MKFITNVQSFLRPFRFLFAVLMCTMLLLSSAVPAEAANSPKSRSTDGTTQLDKILEKAEDAAHSAPMSLKEVEKRSNEGINEVQGAADKNKMKSGNSMPIIVEDLEKAADKVSKN